MFALPVSGRAARVSRIWFHLGPVAQTRDSFSRERESFPLGAMSAHWGQADFKVIGPARSGSDPKRHEAGQNLAVQRNATRSVSCCRKVTLYGFTNLGCRGASGLPLRKERARLGVQDVCERASRPSFNAGTAKAGLKQTAEELA